MATTKKTTTAAPSTLNVVQNEGENSIVDARGKGEVDMTNNMIDSQIEVAEFFCWDCYSDSPHCGERVNTIKAHYLGKTQCSSTNKCFVRRQGDVIYRGCADGWQNSATNIDYEGCRVQQLWGKPVEWCFCTASLCNGDSMEDIKNIYMQHIHPHPYKDNSTSNSSVMTTSATMTSTTRIMKHNPFSQPTSTKTTPSTTSSPTTEKTETSAAETTTPSRSTPTETATTKPATTRRSQNTKSSRHHVFVEANREFVQRSTTPKNAFAARKNPSVTKMFNALVHK
ncbi:uncharacterized protein LOC121377773 [Gigantopelta aegis]|uniref:uncharacterized protein LOC121377773 n=1 Tax=Gigantopelta aegis TaxID=1735272 RepID=UPI001B888481|nr:uncharacterized protein LOC121377773 [Gigantopelta aegis]